MAGKIKILETFFLIQKTKQNHFLSYLEVKKNCTFTLLITAIEKSEMKVTAL